MEDIPLALTEGAWAPLVTNHHYLGRILDPWLPVDSDITSVNQSALCLESSGHSGIKAAMASSQLLLGCTLHTTEGLARLLWDCGVQELVHRARQPHTRLRRAVRCCQEQDWDWGRCHSSPSWVSGNAWDGSRCSWGRGTTSSHFSRESHEALEKDLASSPGTRKIEKNAFSFIWSASGRGRAQGLSEGQLMFSTSKPCVWVSGHFTMLWSKETIDR